MLVQRVDFGRGDTRMCVNITIINDNLVESSEMFPVKIANTPGIRAGPDTQVTIVDDDSKCPRMSSDHPLQPLCAALCRSHDRV